MLLPIVPDLNHEMMNYHDLMQGGDDGEPQPKHFLDPGGSALR